MKRVGWALSVVFLVACGGPSEEGGGVKTPDEIIAEQERLAEEQAREAEKHRKYSGGSSSEETDLEKKPEFDKKQAKLELQRATRSAEQCVSVITENDQPRGETKVTIVFANDGHVKSSSLPAPFADTALGKCVLNAYNAVIVPPYDGPEASVDWDVDLTGKQAEGEEAESKPAKKK